MTDDKHYLGHRQRLKEKFLESGHTALADYELLELLLMQAIPRRDVKPEAKALLATFGTLANVLAATPRQIEDVKGLGAHAAFVLKLVDAMAVRSKRSVVKDRHAFDNRLELLDYLYTQMSGLKHEEFRVLYLDTRNHLIGEETLFRGTINAAAVYPREVVRAALNKGATALVLVHNHPSGDPAPSPDDDYLTAELCSTARPLGIEIIDHIIVGEARHYSYRDHGKL